MTFVIWLGKHGHNTVWSKFDDSCGPNIMPQQFDFSKSPSIINPCQFMRLILLKEMINFAWAKDKMVMAIGSH